MEASLDLLSGRTFSINISNDGAAHLREAVKQKLTVFMGSYTDDVLPVGLRFHSFLVPFCSIAIVFMLVQCAGLRLGLNILATFGYRKLSLNSNKWVYFLWDLMHFEGKFVLF